MLCEPEADAECQGRTEVPASTSPEPERPVASPAAYPKYRWTRLRKTSPLTHRRWWDGRYVNKNGREYTIKQNEIGQYYIVVWGKLPEKLKGKYSKFADAEHALITHLKFKDFWRKAIYPGCQGQKPQSSTEPS